MPDATARISTGPPESTYARSKRSPRGEARRRSLLDKVAADLVRNGLVDFSLRRAAQAADTTHKVLLYHFAGADELLMEAILLLRQRRIEQGLLAAADRSSGPLHERIQALWPILVGAEARILDQAMALAMFDPGRYAELGREATNQNLPSLISLCPETWSDERKLEIANMILAVLRGFLVHARTTANDENVAAGFRALARALQREEASKV